MAKYTKRRDKRGYEWKLSLIHIYCEPETVKEEMQATKELWGKTDGRTYKHYVQSYHEDEEITPQLLCGLHFFLDCLRLTMQTTDKMCIRDSFLNR